MANDCMYCIPHELTGFGEVCGLFGGLPCNQYGKRCAGFKAHTKESSKALAEAIEIKRKERENG